MEEGRSVESPERIEIELTEHVAPAGRRRRRQPAEPTPNPQAPSAAFTLTDDATGVTTGVVTGVVTGGPAPGADGGALGSERRRLVATALAAGVIALFIGWALGRSGGSGEIAGEQPSDSAAATAPATTDPPDDLGEAVPPVASDDLPVTPSTTVNRSGPATTLPPEWVDDIVDIDPRLAASEVELVALGSRQLSTIDLATGERSTIALNSSLNYTGNPRPLFAGDDWIMVYNADSQRADVYEGRSPVERFPFGSNSQVIYQPASETFLLVEQGVSGDGTMAWTLREVPHDGSEPLRELTFELPYASWVQTTDPAGGLVVWVNGGGLYNFDGSTSRRLTSGALLGLSATVIVATECGETLDDCHVYVIDRGTGERRALPEPIGAPTAFDPLYAYWGMILDNISPNGEYVVVNSSGTGPYQFGLLSLTTGEFIPLGEPMGDQSIAWSPDGRLAFYIENGDLVGYDTAERNKIEIAEDLPAVGSFAIRASG